MCPKAIRIRTQKPQNVRKSRTQTHVESVYIHKIHTQTYEKSLNIRKAASSIAQTVSRHFPQSKNLSKASYHAMKKKHPSKRLWLDEIKNGKRTHKSGRLNGKGSASVTGRR